jgi:hypothetical protein
MLLVAVAGIAVGTFGPIYLHGADQSVLQSTLQAAPSGNVGLTLLPLNGAGATGRFGAAAGALPRPAGGPPWFGAPIVTTELEVSSVSRARDSSGQDYTSDLVARTGDCRHLTFSAGGCPLQAKTVALSTRSAAQLGLRLGDAITLAVSGSRRPVELTITGLFRAGNPLASFWWGENFFGFGLSGSATRPLLDDFFATAQTVSAVSPPGRASTVEQLPLRIGALSVNDVTDFTQALHRFEARAPAAYGLQASSEVSGSLDQSASDEHVVGTIVAVVVGELVLLSLMVLYFVAARVAEARKSDVRVADLRGYSRSETAWVALAEPLAVLAVALPLGIVSAWLAARLLAPHVFAPGLTPGLTLLALGAAVVTLAAGALATTIGARGLIGRRNVSGPDRNRPGGGRIVALAIDAVAVAIAIIAVVEIALAGVSSGSRTDPLAALAPALLALGCGVLGARLLPLGARAGIAPTRNSRWVGTSMAARRVARRPEVSRHVVVLALAVGLVSFTVAGWAVAGRNRLTRSEFEVGAFKVLTVRTRTGVDFLHAVQRVDPGGRSAMAVVIENASQGDTLAVDASRLAAVASWPAGLTRQSTQAIGRALNPVTAPPVVLTGSALLSPAGAAGRRLRRCLSDADDDRPRRAEAGSAHLPVLDGRRLPVVLPPGRSGPHLDAREQLAGAERDGPARSLCAGAEGTGRYVDPRVRRRAHAGALAERLRGADRRDGHGT